MRSLRISIRPTRTTYALLLAVSLSVVLAASGMASPVNELNRAIEKSGAPSAKNAAPKQFLGAFSATLLRAKRAERIWYVSAAAKLRPDLADKIVAIALKARGAFASASDPQNYCQEIADIIRAAIKASPELAVDIVKEALKAEPSARTCILEAAIDEAPEQKKSFLSVAGSSHIDPGVIYGSVLGTINPANLSGAQTVNSPEQPPSAP